MLPKCPKCKTSNQVFDNDKLTEFSKIKLGLKGKFSCNKCEIDFE